MPETGSALLPELLRLAEAAGERILRIYHSDFAVERKADDTPVTAADREAEAVILDGLARLTPTIPVISEEAMAEGGAPPPGERYWLVDPLDGTKEFVRRIGEFTVNIGLVESGAPLLGVVHVPVARESYAGAGPGTAFHRNPGGGETPIAARLPAADGLAVLTSRFHDQPERLDAFLAREADRRGTRIKSREAAGSALKFCLVATGRADLYARLGPTMEWDTAAGHALVLAAGGSVETLDGAPLGYGKPGLLNPDFVVRGKRR